MRPKPDPVPPLIYMSGQPLAVCECPPLNTKPHPCLLLLCPQLFNAAKYCSALPALVLSAMEHEAHVHNRPFQQYEW